MYRTPEPQPTRCRIFNRTDNVYASPDLFDDVEQAEKFAESFRRRYDRQGYYKTASGARIDPDEIELELVPVEK